MPRYRITDNTSGRTLLIEGDSPPTEAEAIELFAGQPAGAPPADSARAAQSAAPVAEGKSYRGGVPNDFGGMDYFDYPAPVVETAARVGLPIMAGLAAPVTGGASIPLGLAAAGALTGELLAQQSEMERGARDQASYGQMVAAPVIAGTPLGPTLKGAAYVKDALVAVRPAAVATRAAFGGAISGGANAISQVIDTGEVNGADVLKSAAYGALFGGVMGGVETVQTTRATKAAILDLRQRTGDFRSTDLEFVAKMRRAGQRAPGVSADAIVPAGGRTGAPDGPPPVVQPAAPAAGMPPFDPNVRAVDVVLPRPPPRPPAPPSAPTQVAPPEPLLAPVDNAPVGATPPAAATESPYKMHRYEAGQRDGKNWGVEAVVSIGGGPEFRVSVAKMADNRGYAESYAAELNAKLAAEKGATPPPRAPVDNAPVEAPIPAAIESAPPVPPDKMSATQVSPVAAGSPPPEPAPGRATPSRSTNVSVDESAIQRLAFIPPKNKFGPPQLSVSIAPHEGGWAYQVSAQTNLSGYGGPWTGAFGSSQEAAQAAQGDLNGWLMTQSASGRRKAEGGARHQAELSQIIKEMPGIGRAAAPGLPEPAPVMGESPEPAFYDLISGRIDSPEVDSYMRQQMQSAEERWANLSEQERFVAHAEFGTTNPVILKDGSFPYDLTPSRFSEIVGLIEGTRAPVAAPANQTPEPALDQQIIAAEMAAARATSRFREAGKWSELKGQNARQRWQTLKSQKLDAERTLEDLRAQVKETPPAPVTVPPAAPPGAPGFPAAVVSTGATSRPAPLTVLPGAPEVKPASRRQIAQQRAEIRRLTKLADQAAQTSPERAGQYTAQAQQAREKLGEMESNTTTGSTPQVGPDPLGNADLLTQIADYVGKINMTPPANNVGGEYDGLAAAFSRGAARLLRSSEGGSNIVNAIGELNAAAGTKFESASQFFEAVDRAVSRRQSVARDLDRQAYRDKVEGMVQTDTKKGRPRALVPSAPNVIDEVGVGGEFKLNKEKFSVIDTDEGPGGITLYVIQDGHRFTIPEGTPIYPDKGSLKPAEVAPQKPVTAGPQSDDPFGDNYVPEADAAPAAPAPTQADLVAGIERQAAAPALTLESASVGQQAAEAQAAREAQLVAKRRAGMLAAADRPLTGDSSNVNQGQLYAEDADMFSGASAQEVAASAPNLESQGWQSHGMEITSRAAAEGQAAKFRAEQPTREFAVGDHVAGRGTFEILSRPKTPSGGGSSKDDPNKPGPNDAEAGRISPDALFPLARAVLGGAFGYLEGDTPEEKLAFAMAGALGLGVLGSRRLARRVLAALKPDRTAVPSYPFDPGQPLRAIDKQGQVVGTHTMGALEHVRAIEMPELVHLARQLSGNDVFLRTFPKSHGKFRHRGEDFRIELDRRIFADPVSAQRTMAHELGHMIDYLDDKTMNRGNLLGRLAVLREHLATTLPDTPWNPNQALQPKERVKLRREAEKEIGKRPPQDEEADLAAWKEAVAKEYALLVQEEIESRGLIKDQEIRAELIGVSEWWRPYEADKVSAGYIDYRNSSVELYADALSVLFNAPSELRDRAPLFFDGWMAYLDRKPEAKHALQDAWHFLHQGQVAVVAARNDRIKAGFVKAEEFLINHARERELDRTTLRGIIDQTKQEWWNIYQPIIAKGAAVKAAGVKLPWHQDPEFFFDSHALAENQNYLLLERLQRTVVNPVEASGLTRADLGLYLLHNRVLNESYLDRDGATTGRSVLANPQGITPLQARIALLVRRVPPKHATPEQREAHRARELGLETAARTVQDAFHDLVRDGHQAGIFSDENLALSAANRYNYAPFAVVDYLLRSDRVPAGISRQLGTLHDVANPYLTFVLKGMAVAKLTELNRATTLTVDLLTRYFPGEIERAPERKVALADGSMMTLPPPPPPRGKATLTLLRKGKREAYYVDPSYAKMFDDQMPASAHVVAKVLNYTMRNFFHPLFITYNPGFVYAANPMADTLRSYYALPPGAQRRKWIAENRAAWETARARVAQDVTVQDMPRKRALVALRKQRPLTPAEAVELKVLEARALAFEAVATRALASPADSFAQTGGNTDDLWGRMLRDHSLISDEPGRFLKLAETYLPYIVKTAKMVERHGMMSEALPKLAAYNMIGKTAGWSKEQVAFYVRNNIGTPNTYKRGSRAVVNGAFLPYINVFTRGMESDLAVARGKVVGPESRGRKAAEFWRRMTESSFVPSLLQALAMVGVFGAALKKCYDGFSEYDKMNYLIIPLGTWETDTVHGYKSAGIRIRLTETMRFTNSFLQHVVTRAADNDPAASASLGHLFEFGAGQVPGAHPLVKLGGSWAQFAAGIQPRDNFRGSPVVQTADWKAGGWERTKGMLAYTWNDSGLGGMVRFDSKSQNIMEFTASATPVVNRLIRFSDSGLREREERFDKREAETIYKIRSQMPRSVNELLQEYSALQSVGDRRDDRQQVRYKELGVWHLKVWTPTYQEMKIAPPKDWRSYGEGLGIDSEPYQRKNQK